MDHFWSSFPLLYSFHTHVHRVNSVLSPHYLRRTELGATSINRSKKTGRPFSWKGKKRCFGCGEREQKAPLFPLVSTEITLCAAITTPPPIVSFWLNIPSRTDQTVANRSWMGHHVLICLIVPFSSSSPWQCIVRRGHMARRRHVPDSPYETKVHVCYLNLAVIGTETSLFIRGKRYVAGSLRHPLP